MRAGIVVRHPKNGYSLTKMIFSRQFMSVCATLWEIPHYLLIKLIIINKVCNCSLLFSVPHFSPPIPWLYYRSITQQQVKPMQKAHSDKYISANVILKQKQQLGALLIGDCTSAIDKHVLKPYKVYTVITIGQDSAPARQQQHIAYILHNVLDNKSQKIDDMFDTVYEQIEAGRKAGGVLVHCYTGISRSPAFVIAYLMRKKFTAYDDARAFVKKQRTVAHPNDNFHRQLQGYWKLLQARNQEQKSIIKVETKQVEHKQQQISSQSELMMSNLSAVSKRTIRGIKGAVPPAFRSKSIQNRSIEETNQHSKDKQADSSTISPNKQTKKTEQRQKQVTQIYSNKTKVI